MVSEIEYERWNHWPVNWTAVMVGALSALALGTVCSLIGVAVSITNLSPDARIVTMRDLTVSAMVLGVCGAFFSFVVGGWSAGKIAGILHSESAMLHGAIVWLVVLPAVLILSAVGAGAYSGSWYAGLGGSSIYEKAPYTLESPALSAAPSGVEQARYDATVAEYQRRITEWNAGTAAATRSAALLALTALLTSLMGAVIGGWMASGEPMSIGYRRTNRQRTSAPI